MSVFLPGEFHGQRSLVGYSLWSCRELGMNEQLIHTHTTYILCFLEIFFKASNCPLAFRPVILRGLPNTGLVIV